MKRTKLIFPIALTVTATSMLPLVACNKQEEEEKEEKCTITFQVEGEGEVSANTLEAIVGKPWVNVENKPTITPQTFWMLDGLYIDGQKVKDDTIITGNCTMLVKFVRNPAESKLIKFKVRNEEAGTVDEVQERIWSGYTFADMKELGLLPETHPYAEYVFKGWYQDENCTIQMPDDTLVYDIDTIYVDFRLDPAKYCHIEFALEGEGGGAIEDGQETDISIGSPWYEVNRPTVRALKGYVQAGYYLDGKLLQDDDIIEHDCTITVKFEECTAQELFNYSINYSDNTASITELKSTPNATKVVVPSYIYLGSSAYAVKTIGTINQTVVFNDNLIESIIIPEGVETIQANVFGTCPNLNSVSFPETLKTVSGKLFADTNEKITSLSFGQNVETLKPAALSNLPNLSSLYISSKNRFFSDGSNYGGKNVLVNINTKAVICGLKGAIIPNSVSINAIGETAFSYSPITNIDIPWNITTINNGAFSNSQLETITFSTGTVSKNLTIGSRAFSSCSKLSEINLPDRTYAIESNAFEKNIITSLHIPQKTISIGQAITYRCENLETITVAEGNKNYSCGTGGANCIVSIKDASNKELILGCKNTVFPTDVTKIGVQAFYGTNFKGDSEGVFNIPNWITTLGQNAFNECSGLKKLIFPATLKSIGVSCFFSCTQVAELDLTAFGDTFPTDLHWSPFTFASKGTIKLAKLKEPEGEEESELSKWQTYLHNTCGFYLDDEDGWKIEQLE